ncbi:hypothetical protein DPMN_074399 [Dreissena polymorpha]|uniref:Uncharacterized protein n=2 Tax=Dreissena polymorpha TaxID=45954 RepID=A0A9D3YII9_DREPO|nr:hypothetical protein DPMN_074399 [Dreissena polymorpha]
MVRVMKQTDISINMTSKYCRRRYIRRIALISCVVLIISLAIYFHVIVRQTYLNINIRNTCVIPILDPFDPSIMPYVWEPGPLACDKTPQLIHQDDTGVLRFNTTLMELLNLQKDQVHCVFRIVTRNRDDATVKFGEETHFVPEYSVKADVYQVICRDRNGDVIFEKVLTSVNVGDVTREVSVMDETRDQLSVVFLGIDSVSRSAAFRKLPKSMKYLKEDLNSYDLRGLMKVGENTFPNIMALLAGNVFHGFCDTTPCDDLPFIWKNFSAKGYATFFAEDWTGESTFENHKGGWRDPPTDHFMRPFYLAIEQLAKENKLNKIGSFLKYQLELKNIIGQSATTFQRMCYKDLPQYVHQNKFLKQFLTSYTNKRKFALSFTNTLCHEADNLLSYGDDFTLEFLRWLKYGGHLENTVFVLFADHGSRLERIRNTLVGRLEDRMPVMELLVPEHIKERYPSLDRALRVNQDRLITFFDFHQTLIDIMNQSFRNPTIQMENGRTKGISLFNEIPAARSCYDAWIPENFCACYESVQVGTDTTDSQLLAAHMLREINQLKSGQPKCIELNLHKVQEVRKISDGLKHVESTLYGRATFFNLRAPEKSRLDRLEVTLVTYPGCGIFEATYEMRNRVNIQRIGEIVRINRYGNTSHCMHVKELKPFCFCGDVTSKPC